MAKLQTEANVLVNQDLAQSAYELADALETENLTRIASGLGIAENVELMTQQEKAMLRTIALLKQSTSAYGDMARTITSPANQMRIFQQQVTLLQRSLGNMLLPAISAVLPYFIAFLKVLRSIVDILANFFGFQLPEFDYSELGTIGDSFADSMDDAANSAKKIKTYLAGFDELNILNTDSGSGTGASGGRISLEYEKLQQEMNKWAEELDRLFLKDIQNNIDGIVNSMKEWLGITDEIDSWSELMNTRFGKILRLVGLIALGFAAWSISKDVLAFIALVNLSGVGFARFAFTLFGIAGALVLIYGAVDALLNQLDWSNLFTIIAGIALLGIAFKGLAGLIAMSIGGIILLGVGFKDFIDNGRTAQNVTAVAVAIGIIGLAIGGTAGILTAAILGGVALVVFFADKVYGAITWITFLIGNIGKVVWNVIGYIVQIVLNAVKLIVNGVMALGAIIWNIISGILNRIVGLFEGIKAIGHNIGIALSNPFETAQYVAFSFVENVLKTIKTLADKLNGILSIFGQEIDTKGLDKVIADVEKNKNELQEELKFEDVQDAFDKGMQTFKYADIGDAFQTLDYTFEPIFEWDTVFAEGWSAEAFGIGEQFGKDMQETIREGLSGVFGDQTENMDKNIKDNADNTSELANSLIPNMSDTLKQMGLDENQMSEDMQAMIKTGFKDVETAINGIDINIIQQYSGISPDSFASGGFPEDGLFFANSRELVGRFSNGKTAVANNEQITEGIRQAVYEAMVASGSAGGKEITINNVLDLDGETVYKNQRKIEANRGVSIGMGAFAR